MLRRIRNVGAGLASRGMSASSIASGSPRRAAVEPGCRSTIAAATPPSATHSAIAAHKTLLKRIGFRDNEDDYELWPREIVARSAVVCRSVTEEQRTHASLQSAR